MNKKLVVIVAHSGAGKSTLSEMLARKNDYALLCEDDFVFAMNPASMVKRIPRKSDRIYGLNNLKMVLAVYLGTKKSVVIEGELVDGPFYLDDFRKMAEQYDFDFIPIMLVGDESKRRRRKIRKGYAVAKTVDARLRRGARKLGYPEECHQIDTTKQSLQKTFDILDKYVRDWPFQDIKEK